MKRLFAAALVVSAVLSGCVTSKWTLNFVDGTNGDGDGFACFKTDPKKPEQRDCAEIQLRREAKKKLAPGEMAL